MIELPRFAPSEENPLLGRWVRFLRATSIDELQSLASEDPIMARAKAAYEHVTRDEANRRLAETRLKAQMNWAIMRDEERQEGREEGREEGRQEGREEGRQEGRAGALRESIVVVSAVLGLSISASRRARLEGAGLAELEAILAALEKTRRWLA